MFFVKVPLGASFLPSAFAQAPSPTLIPASGKLGQLSGAGASCDFMTGVLHFDCIPLYIGYLMKIAIGFAGGFFLTSLLLAGYKYAIGSVTTEGKEGGKKQIIGAVTGFSIAILSYLLVDTIINALT